MEETKPKQAQKSKSATFLDPFEPRADVLTRAHALMSSDLAQWWPNSETWDAQAIVDIARETGPRLVLSVGGIADGRQWVQAWVVDPRRYLDAPDRRVFLARLIDGFQKQVQAKRDAQKQSPES